MISSIHLEHLFKSQGTTLQALDVLEEHLVGSFGSDAIIRIDHSTSSSERHAAMTSFEKEPRYCLKTCPS